jgi:hypothetical protein
MASALFVVINREMATRQPKILGLRNFMRGEEGERLSFQYGHRVKDDTLAEHSQSPESGITCPC